MIFFQFVTVNYVREDAVGDGRLRPLVRPPGELDETYASFLILAHLL